MNPEAQKTFLAHESSHTLQSLIGHGFKDSLLNGTLSQDKSQDPMKALLISSLLKHPKTQIAGMQPKIIPGGEYNDKTLQGKGTLVDKVDPDIASLVKREITRGKYNTDYHINSPAMQERLAMLQSKHDIVLVTGGFEYDKIPYLAQQTLRNNLGRVLVLTNDHHEIENLKARTTNSDNIKYLTHHEALELQFKDKLSSTFNTIILNNLQIRTIPIDLWLYLIKSGLGGRGTENRKYLLVSHGLRNKSIVDYLGGDKNVGIFDINRNDKDSVHIFNNYVLNSQQRNNLTTAGKSSLFWNAVFARISQALKKIYLEGYRYNDGNIVVFLPHQRSINECFRFIQQSLGDLLSRMVIYQNGSDIINTNHFNKTIVYLTTEIPSIVPRVGHVIDSGLKIIRNYNPETHIHSWKLGYLDDIEAKEREALASVSVFKLYDISATEANEKVEILRSPSVSKFIIKLLGDRRINGKKQLQQIMVRDLIDPLSRDRFLDFWEPLQDLGLIKKDILTFLAKDCFSPLDLDLKLCTILLMGRKVVQNLEFLAQVVAILNIGGSILGNWIYDDDLLSRYQSEKGDVFGLVKLINDNPQNLNINYANINKTHKISLQILNKLRNLDDMCLIVPDQQITGNNDTDKIIHILRNIYSDLHLVIDRQLNNNKPIKLKKGLVSVGRRCLALELKEFSQFSEKRQTLYGNMLINLP